MTQRDKQFGIASKFLNGTRAIFERADSFIIVGSKRSFRKSIPSLVTHPKMFK